MKSMARRVMQPLRRWRRNRDRLAALAACPAGLCYHAVGDASDLGDSGRLHNLDPAVFERQIRYLEARIEFVPVGDFFARRAAGETGFTTLTFDDAYRCLLDHALPFLDDAGIPYTIFVNSDTLDGHVLWRDRIRMVLAAGLEQQAIAHIAERWPEHGVSLSASGLYKGSKSTEIDSSDLDEALRAFCDAHELGSTDRLYCSVADMREVAERPMASLGNHTASHYFLASLNPQEQHEQFARCQQALDGVVAQKTRVAALPFGGYHTFNQDTLEALQTLKFQAFFMTNPADADLGNPPRPLNTSLRYANRMLPQAGGFGE